MEEMASFNQKRAVKMAANQMHKLQHVVSEPAQPRRRFLFAFIRLLVLQIRKAAGFGRRIAFSFLSLGSDIHQEEVKNPGSAYPTSQIIIDMAPSDKQPTGNTKIYRRYQIIEIN